MFSTREDCAKIVFINSGQATKQAGLKKYQA